MEVHDIILDENGDIAIENGDFSVGECTRQNQKLLLLCQKGEFKQNPSKCVGLATYLERNELGDLNREILSQFSSDGMRVNSISAQMPELKIEAEYYES